VPRYLGAVNAGVLTMRVEEGKRAAGLARGGPGRAGAGWEPREVWYTPLVATAYRCALCLSPFTAAWIRRM
jgi:hypothetical protein